MKKRIISFVLLITIVLSFSFNVNASFSQDSDMSKAGLLTELGIIEKTENESELSNEVSRREFAIIAAKMLNIDVYAINTNRYYVDMVEDDLCWNATGALVEQGILTVGADKKFRPDDTIKFEEAACVMMKILGVKNLEYSMYASLAQKDDVVDGISSKNLTMRDVITLVHNTLNSYTYRVKSSGAFGYEYEQTSETFMEKMYDLFYVEGVVNAVNLTSIDSFDTNNQNTVQIGDVVINTGNEDYYEYLGNYVSAYYRDNDDYLTLVYMSEREKRNDKVKINIDNFVGFDSDTYIAEYYESGKTKRIDIEKGANIIKNGENILDDAEGSFYGLTNGDILFIDADSVSGYETVIINSYYNVAVNYVDTEKMKIYGKNNNTVVDLSDDKISTIITSADGSVIDFNSIPANATVSVFESSKLKRLVVSQSTVNGEVSAVAKEDEKTIVSIGGASYEVDGAFKSQAEKILVPGNKILGYVDNWGKIVYAEIVQNTNANYAWIIRYFTDEDTETVNLKLFTQNNEIITLPLNDKVRIDGITYKTNAEIISALSASNKNVSEQLVTVSINADNKISAIDTLAEGSLADGLFESSPKATHYYFAGQTLLGPTIHINTNTKVFIVPASDKYKDDETSYKLVKGTSFFKDWEQYEVVGYRTGNKDSVDVTEAILLRRDLNGVAHQTKFESIYVIKGISNIYDENSGEIRTQVQAVSGKNEYEYTCAQNYDIANDVNFKKGNVVKMSYNPQNEITSIELLYGTTTDGTKKLDTYKYGNWSTKNEVACGYVTSIENGLIGLALNRDEEPFLVLKTGTAGVAVFDEAEKESVFAGDESDLIEAYNMGFKVVVNISRGNVRSFAVVK